MTFRRHRLRTLDQTYTGAVLSTCSHVHQRWLVKFRRRAGSGPSGYHAEPGVVPVPPVLPPSGQPREEDISVHQSQNPASGSIHWLYGERRGDEPDCRDGMWV